MLELPRWPVQINKDSPQAQGLIAWWPIFPQPGSRILYDCSGYANHLTFGSTTNWQTDRQFGRVIYGDNTSNSAMTAADTDKLDALTAISFWFRHNMADWNISGLFSKNDTTTYSHGILLTDRGTNLAALYISGTSAGNFECIHNTWYHGYINLVSRTVYVNGKYIGAAGSSFVSNASKPFVVGANYYLGWRYLLNTRLTDIRVYSITHSAGMIASMYEPATRYDLYYTPRRKWYYAPSAASFLASWAAGSNQMIGGGTP